MKFNERLKELRLSRKLTQEEFAKRIGISRSAVGMYEKEKREPDLETLELFADFFNVDMNYLLGKSDTSTDISSLKSVTISVSKEEQHMLRKYRQLSPAGKATVDAVIDIQYNSVKPRLKSEEETCI